MIIIRLAFRNVIGVGVRTWLNVVVLSMCYVVIIWQGGFLEGWNRQAQRDMIAWEIGSGQYWQENYDPYDVFSLEEAHSVVPQEIKLFSEGKAAPVLISQGAIYTGGRMKNVLLKGIDPDQEVLAMPTRALSVDIDEIPVLIGSRMARSIKARSGDLFTIRWRDVNGTFDALQGKVVQVMKTDVPTVDQGVLWLPLDRLREMLQMQGEATLIVMGGDKAEPVASLTGWAFKDRAWLLKDISDLIRIKSVSGYFIYAVLLSLALLAIFDTQVLSVFYRHREIGTLIALGMTRKEVVLLFTLEGALHGVLAGIAAILYGVPLLAYSASNGLGMPKVTDSMGLAIAERIFPVYTGGLVAVTTLTILIAVTVVSFIPAKKISRLEPADAIRGRSS